METKHTDGCFQRTEDDEPLFTLLARDPLAPLLVNLWAALSKQTGQPQTRRDEAWIVADEMKKWRKEHRPITADVDKTLALFDEVIFEAIWRIEEIG